MSHRDDTYTPVRTTTLVVLFLSLFFGLTAGLTVANNFDEDWPDPPFGPFPIAKEIGPEFFAPEITPIPEQPEEPAVEVSAMPLIPPAKPEPIAPPEIIDPIVTNGEVMTVKTPAPVVQKPVISEPPPVSIVQEEKTSVVEEPVISEPVPVVEDVIPEPVVEEIVVETPVVEPVVEEPVIVSDPSLEELCAMLELELPIQQ